MSRKKIMLVDDVQLIIELEKVFLKGLPVDVIEARNGQEALELARRELPDLIYLDLNMPVMDGPACCRTLKSDPLTSHIPIIMVTTAGKLEDELLCRSSGCDDFITKPINSKLFLDKGRSCLVDFERRRKRYRFSTDVLFLKNGEPKFGMTTDISKGGIFIATPLDALPDNPVDFSFSLPLKNQSVLVAARGRIAWKNRPQEPKKPTYPPGVGVEFTDIDSSKVMLIERFLEEYLENK